MSRLLDIARPHHACITALTPVHLEGMGNLATIVEEKLKLAATVPPDGRWVWLPEQAAQLIPTGSRWPGRTVRLAFGPHRDGLQILSRRPGAYRVVLPRLGELNLPVYADHEVLLAAMAVAVGFELGESADALRERLLELRRPEGRLTVHRVGPVTLLDDAYNASPARCGGSLGRVAALARYRPSHRGLGHHA